MRNSLVTMILRGFGSVQNSGIQIGTGTECTTSTSDDNNAHSVVLGKDVEGSLDLESHLVCEGIEA